MSDPTTDAALDGVRRIAAAAGLSLDPAQVAAIAELATHAVHVLAGKTWEGPEAAGKAAGDAVDSVAKAVDTINHSRQP